LHLLLCRLDSEIKEQNLKTDNVTREWLIDVVDGFINKEKYERLEQKRIKKEAIEVEQKLKLPEYKEELIRRRNNETLFEAIDDLINSASTKIQKNGNPISYSTIYQ